MRGWIVLTRWRDADLWISDGYRRGVGCSACQRRDRQASLQLEENLRRPPNDLPVFVEKTQFWRPIASHTQSCAGSSKVIIEGQARLPIGGHLQQGTRISGEIDECQIRGSIVLYTQSRTGFSGVIGEKQVWGPAAPYT